MTMPTPPQPGGPKKTSGGKIAALGCGGLVLLIIVIGVVGAALGGSKAKTSNTSADANPTVGISTTKVITASPAPAASSPAATKTTKPSKSAAPSDNPTPCGPNRDIIVRYKVPGLDDSAQVLGSWNVGTCQSTLDFLQQTSPKDAGYCTWAAYASDNPGYNADATPAKPLKKVILAVGAGC